VASPHVRFAPLGDSRASTGDVPAEVVVGSVAGVDLTAAGIVMAGVRCGDRKTQLILSPLFSTHFPESMSKGENSFFST
jgi:hypothetical protein